MTDLRELEKRLEEATGCLDEPTVAELLYLPWRNDPGPWRWWLATGDAGETEMWIDGPGWPSGKAYSCLHEWPDRSLDAAVALVERVLPSNRDDGRVWLQLLDDAVTTALASDAKPEDMARLVCITLIRALIAKGDRHD